MSFSQLANVRQIALYNKMNFTSIYFAFKLFYSVSKEHLQASSEKKTEQLVNFIKF